MVTLGWKYLTEAEPKTQGGVRIVSDPIEHQGLRAALRNAYECGGEIPSDFQALLNKIN